MELTRTDAVFSRLSMVLFMCRKKSSRNDLKLHETYFWEILKNTGRRIHVRGASTYPRGWGARPLPRGPPVTPPTSTPTPYIRVQGEKYQREGFITFYDTEPPPSPVLPREGRSRVCSGLRRGESVAIVIINHPPSPIS